MKKPVTVTLEPKQIAQLDTDVLAGVLGRSGIVRMILAQHYESEKKSERNRNEENSKKEK
jgi:hypothetical protein